VCALKGVTVTEMVLEFVNNFIEANKNFVFYFVYTVKKVSDTPAGDRKIANLFYSVAA
jgi:hypothetical protein